MFFFNDLLEVLEHKGTLGWGRGRIVEDDKGIHELIEMTRCELDSWLGWVNRSVVTVLIAHYTGEQQDDANDGDSAAGMQSTADFGDDTANVDEMIDALRSFTLARPRHDFQKILVGLENKV